MNERDMPRDRKPKKKTEQGPFLRIKVSDEELERIKELAKDQALTISSYIRHTMKLRWDEKEDRKTGSR